MKICAVSFDRTSSSEEGKGRDAGGLGVAAWPPSFFPDLAVKRCVLSGPRILLPEPCGWKSTPPWSLARSLQMHRLTPPHCRPSLREGGAVGYPLRDFGYNLGFVPFNAGRVLAAPFAERP